jgi:hypothetical protein
MKCKYCDEIFAGRAQRIIKHVIKCLTAINNSEHRASCLLARPPRGVGAARRCSTSPKGREHQVSLWPLWRCALAPMGTAGASRRKPLERRKKAAGARWIAQRRLTAMTLFSRVLTMPVTCDLAAKQVTAQRRDDGDGRHQAYSRVRWFWLQRVQIRLPAVRSTRSFRLQLHDIEGVLKAKKRLPAGDHGCDE